MPPRCLGPVRAGLADGAVRALVSCLTISLRVGIGRPFDHVFDHLQIADADRLRRAIGNSFERASYPAMDTAERRRTLTFVVVGAGPTGVGKATRAPRTARLLNPKP